MKEKVRKAGIKRFIAVLVAFALIFPLFSDVAKVSAAGSPYLIKVNRKMCTVTIYKKDSAGNYTVPVKAMLCSPGWDTPLGTFRTPARYRWQLLMGDVWGQYCTRITTGILFHSVWYYERNEATLSNRQFNNLGTVCSHGCVRLNVADVKWIYDNCPLGTTVIIYDSNNPGPLGKPEGIKVSTASRMGYDPTDIWCSSNPYNKKKPSIQGAKSQRIAYGSNFTAMSGVSAISSTGTNITSKVKTTIKYNNKKVSQIDTKKAGNYKVTYSVVDLLKRKAKKTVTIKVAGDTTPPKLYGVKNQTVKGTVKINRSYVLKNVTAKQSGNILAKSKIKTEIQKDSDGNYSVKYFVKAENGKTDTATAKITVDRKAPVFEGVKNKTITSNVKVTKSYALKGVTVSDNITAAKKLKIAVAIIQPDDRTYKITYSCKDAVGNKAKKTVTYKVKNKLVIKGAKDITVASGTAINSKFVFSQGVKATINGKDVTDKMLADIKPLKNGNYKVTYTIVDELGDEKSVSIIYTIKDIDKTEDKTDDTEDKNDDNIEEKPEDKNNDIIEGEKPEEN